MRMIADKAGVTQGPRQYYFPTPAHLYEAVVDHIQTTAEGNFRTLRKRIAEKSANMRIKSVVELAIRGCGNPNHLAMIELKLACRGNRTLRDAIEKKILEYEERTDESWAEMLEDSGLSKTELINMRTVLGATVRGLGIANAAGSPRSENQKYAKTIIDLVSARLAEVRAI